MSNILTKSLSATKSILEKSLDLQNPIFLWKKIVLVFDRDSYLSRIISDSYIENLSEYENVEIIDFSDTDKDLLKEKLLWLEKNSTVMLVQSTNFRLDDFRIRLSLQKLWVGCLEHNHLSYILQDESETYINSIMYKTPELLSVSNSLKSKIESWDKLTFKAKNWSILEITGWFEEMKQNTWVYDIENRGSTLPFWENFTESKVFDNVNGELSIYAFPDLSYKVNFVEPFTIKIEKSIIISYSENTPKSFIELLDMIKNSEDWEVMVRELWFWLNDSITDINKLSDVNAYERKLWFHISIWKKHGIYRKKLHKKITQRYHIDIFPDLDYISLDWEVIFDWKWFTL